MAKNRYIGEYPVIGIKKGAFTCNSAIEEVILPDSIEKIENGEVIERVSDPAVWELMYFGKSSADERYKTRGKLDFDGDKIGRASWRERV